MKRPLPPTNEKPMTTSNLKPITQSPEVPNCPAPEPFIDKPEVARRMQKCIRTIDNLMRRGLLPYYKIGRSVNFKWSEVEACLAASCRVGWRNRS